jgi:hypothetical protein
MIGGACPGCRGMAGGFIPAIANIYLTKFFCVSDGIFLIL